MVSSTANAQPPAAVHAASEEPAKKEYILHLKLAEEELPQFRALVARWDTICFTHDINLAEVYPPPCLNPCPWCGVSLDKDETAADAEGVVFHRTCLAEKDGLDRNDAIWVEKSLWEPFAKAAEAQHQDPLKELEHLVRQAITPGAEVDGEDAQLAAYYAQKIAYKCEFVIDAEDEGSLRKFAKTWRMVLSPTGESHIDPGEISFRGTGCLPIQEFKDFMFELDGLSWVNGTGLQWHVVGTEVAFPGRGARKKPAPPAAAKVRRSHLTEEEAGVVVSMQAFLGTPADLKAMLAALRPFSMDFDGMSTSLTPAQTKTANALWARRYK